jgi:hypothetical protein
MALIDERICHALPDKVIADREALQAMLFEDVAAGADILVAFQSLINFKVIAPTREFQAVIAKARGFLRHRVEC